MSPSLSDYYKGSRSRPGGRSAAFLHKQWNLLGKTKESLARAAGGKGIRAQNPPPGKKMASVNSGAQPETPEAFIVEEDGVPLAEQRKPCPRPSASFMLYCYAPRLMRRSITTTMSLVPIAASSLWPE